MGNDRFCIYRLYISSAVFYVVLDVSISEILEMVMGMISAEEMAQQILEKLWDTPHRGEEARWVRHRIIIAHALTAFAEERMKEWIETNKTQYETWSKQKIEQTRAEALEEAARVVECYPGRPDEPPNSVPLRLREGAKIAERVRALKKKK